MKQLSRQDILSAEDRKTEVVEVPEWGGSVTIRAMSGKQRDEWLTAGRNQAGSDETRPDPSNMTARLVAMTVVDESGAAMFTLAEAVMLNEKNAEVLDRVGVVAARISGLAAKAVEVAEKNSAPAPSGDSTSA